MQSVTESGRSSSNRTYRSSISNECTREQLEQKDVEMEAAEALLHVHHSVAHAKEVLAQHAKERVGCRRL